MNNLIRVKVNRYNIELSTIMYKNLISVCINKIHIMYARDDNYLYLIDILNALNGKLNKKYKFIHKYNLFIIRENNENKLCININDMYVNYGCIKLQIKKNCLYTILNIINLFHSI